MRAKTWQMRLMTMATGLGIIALFIGAYVATSAALAWLFRALWNQVVPSVFDGPRLTFWQAFCGMFLLSIVASFFRPTTTQRD